MSDGRAPADADADAPAPWHLTASAVARLLGGTTLVLAGLLLARSDVAAIGAPLLLTVAWGLARTPVEATAVAVGMPRHDPRQARIEASLDLDPAPGASTTRLRVEAPEHRPLDVLVDGRGPRRLTLALETARTGRMRPFEVDHLHRSTEAVHRTAPGTVRSGSLVVLPGIRPLGELPLPFRLQGLTGAHRSARPGDGGDLRDIAVFATGDRLRRIDWKTTARRAGPGARLGTARSELYVRRTFATADAQVMLVLDSRDAVGPDVATWGQGEVHPGDPTSLDVARRAAASLARRYLDQGDRVGLVDLARHQRPLRPAGGRRHLRRVVHHLATVGPKGEPATRIRAPQLPSGTLVVVLSTLLDDGAVQLAQTWRHTGHRVVVVDVLPTLAVEHLSPRTRTAYRIVRLERVERLAALGASGVEVVTWEHDGAGLDRPEVALRALARTRRVGR